MATQAGAPGTPAAMERCWICLEELRRGKDEWVYPCSCSLVCHEDLPYRIVQWRSTTFRVLHAMYGAVDRAIPFVLAMAGSMGVFIACTAHGAYTVMAVYGQKDSTRILGSIGRWDHTKWMWLPAIPMALIWSRFQLGTVYMPLSTLLMTAPLPLRMQWPMRPALTLAVLPTISSVYRHLWGLTLGRVERRWESHMPPEQDTLTIRALDAGLDNGAEDNNNNNNAAIDADGHAAAALAANQARAQQQQQQQQQQLGLGLPMQAGRNFEATIVLNGASIGRTLVESLLLPTISSALGAAICKLPFVRRAGLGHFSRAMLGGCAYFVVKDLVRVLYKYLLYRSRSSRSIEGRKRF
ncbi:hypothetical protein H4R18_004489 [Coemansia javaensis]|uniref:RING-CH-type domain-containing protein n=1 Tax=Coemansia javaensis TaxID=2761396 RepID=A0A9W8H7L3_9FUNG|nr:hypothetical protein H4R18_004489 [Coemansia javaensis]